MKLLKSYKNMLCKWLQVCVLSSSGLTEHHGVMGGGGAWLKNNKRKRQILQLTTAHYLKLYIIHEYTSIWHTYVVVYTNRHSTDSYCIWCALGHLASGQRPVARALAWPPLNARQINGNCMQIARCERPSDTLAVKVNQNQDGDKIIGGIYFLQLLYYMCMCEAASECRRVLTERRCTGW